MHGTERERTGRRQLGAVVVSALLATGVASGLGGPAGTARTAELDAELVAAGVEVVVDGFTPARPACTVQASMFPLYASTASGPPTPRGAALARAAALLEDPDTDRAMLPAVVGRTRGGERAETWTVLHAGGAVTELSIGPAPAGGWLVLGSTTCGPPAP